MRKMEAPEIWERLHGIFVDVFGDDSLKLTPELSAEDVDEWDSMTHIRLVISVEKAFGMKFSAAEVGGLKNVGDLVQLIQSKQ